MIVNGLFSSLEGRNEASFHVPQPRRRFHPLRLLRSAPHLNAVDAELVEDGRVGRHLGGNLRGGLGFKGQIGAFLLIVDGGFDLTLGLQRRDDVLVFPSDLVSESSEDAEFAVRLESEDAQSRGNDVPLSLVVRSRNSLVGAVTFHRVLTTGQLVGQHSADGLVKDSGRCPVMEGSSFGVDQTPFAKVFLVFELVAVKATRNVDAFAPDSDDSLSLEKRLGDDGGETTKEMTAAIDDQRLGGETHLSRDYLTTRYNETLIGLISYKILNKLKLLNYKLPPC